MSVEFVGKSDGGCVKCYLYDDKQDRCIYVYDDPKGKQCDENAGYYVDTTDYENIVDIPTPNYTPTGKYETAITGYCGNTAWIDYYTIFQAFNVDPVLVNPVKKLLGNGDRGHKSKRQDVKEARDACNQWLKLNGGLDD